MRKNIALIAKILLFYFSTTSFALFILEEAAQTVGFSRFVNKDLDISPYIYQIQRKARIVGILNPVAWWWFKDFFMASDLYASQGVKK